MPEVFLSIGSNIDPDTHIPAAIKDLRTLFGPLRLSSTYETAAVGFAGPSFHNLIVALDSDRDPREIARLCREIEERHGRTRQSQKFSSRTLDVDLILYGDTVLEESPLHLPRDEITRYAFVLEPLAEIASEHRHPVTGQTYAELWAAFDKSGLEQKKIAPAALVK
jgi:2-amino-4-hydroxy-6-hydroxymethyldihydropteridine diphosphokinase